MKPQKQSLYTRRFNKLKKQIIDSLGVETSDTAVLRWGPECCVVAHDGQLGFTLYFRNELTDEIEHILEIVKTPYCSLSGLIGIHVQETNLHHLLDQIDAALKDGFERIYVRSIASLSEKKGA